MPATGTRDCPVWSFEKYMEKLDPEFDRLWCYPKDSFHADDECWYTRKPVGVNTLQTFLAKLSKKCGLSQIYTNHSIRATSATVLHRAHHAPAEIQAVTGHKSLASLAIYQHTSVQQKLDMGDTLARQIAGPSTQLQVVKPPSSNYSGRRGPMQQKPPLPAHRMRWSIFGTRGDRLKAFVRVSLISSSAKKTGPHPTPYSLHQHSKIAPFKP